MPEPANVPASPAPLEAERPTPKDDMNDAAEIRDYETKIAQGHHLDYRPLCTALSLVQDTVHHSFTKCDKEALYYQKWYQNFSIAAVFFGALTILVAILEFIVRGHATPMTIAEGIIGAVTLLLIAVGLLGEFKEKWLTARYKAENLRLLKFRELTDSRLWCPPINMNLLREELRDEVHKIEAQNYDKVKEWATEGVRPRVCAPPCEKICDLALREFVDYYRVKRLHVQTNYLKQKSESGEARGARTAMIVRWIFFTSFAFVLTHVVLQWYTTTHPPAAPQAAKVTTVNSGEVPAPGANPANSAPQNPASGGTNVSCTPADCKPPDDSALAMWLIGLAAGLPVIAAAVRTYRASREFERNSLRHRATLDSLEELERELRTSDDLNQQFRLLGFCELVLEMDCREFIRLLREVEWYG
jgi:hypothetical protein